MHEKFRSIHVDHNPAIYAIEPTPSPDESAVSEPLQMTLLELVQAVGDASDSEEEVVATVVYMLRSGRISLTGNFRDCSVEELSA